ncbi:MAG: hypothetical protein PHN79_04750 [Methanoregula sp.]|nr:hypothetical protein [Methanoregula sp.]
MLLCCPACKSRDIFPVAGGYMGQVYLCKSCRYRGSFVLEIDDPESAGTAEERESQENQVRN